jgi:hypothetical protein
MARDYVVYEKKVESSELLVRKINENSVGVCVTKHNYTFPFTSNSETFLNRSDTLTLILELIQYFKITQDDLGF